MAKHSIVITDERLYNDLVEYCRLNNEKISNFCQRVLKEQLLVEKYGNTPFGNVTYAFELPPVIPINAVEPPLDTVQMPYELDKVTETITNGDISEKYKDKKVPKEFYGEIKIEEPKRKKIRRL
jgi:hypothetical protein